MCIRDRHLNKLVVHDFPRKTTIKQEMLKYRILNIFYDREKEIEFLEELLSEELNLISDKKKYMEWIKTAKKQFERFRYELKLEKRRKKENLSHHSLEKAKNNFEELMRHIKTGCGAKNLALLQNQCKPSQLGNLSILLRDKITHKGKNYSVKMQKYYFCNGTTY